MRVDCRDDGITAGNVGADAFVGPAERSEAYACHDLPLALFMATAH